MNTRLALNRLAEIEQGLFFIVGCGRSGTTLMKSILNAHPDIYLPHETSFFTGVSRGSFSEDQSSLDDKINLMLSKWWLADMDLSAESITRWLGDHPPTWRNLFLAMLASLSEEHPATRFGEKTVNHVEYADQLLTEYPECRMLQVVRDPRAAFASFRAAPIGSNQVSQFIKDWSLAASVDERLSGHDRYLRVCFEDLINQTESTAKSICNFLDLNYDPEMMCFHQRKDPGYSPEQSHHQNTQKPIFRTGLEKWKNELSPAQIGLLELYLGDQMDRIGYQRTGKTIGLPKLRMTVSALMEEVSKNVVRRPRQYFKAIRARKRQSKSHG